jgi:ankyrin repeat protein
VCDTCSLYHSICLIIISSLKWHICVFRSDFRNRFRWAACQLDELRRLKPEINNIRAALADLPASLDETYERIFIRIPKEDQLFVYYALQWISFHNGQFQLGNIPLSTLLQAVERSSPDDNNLWIRYLFDEARLRECCGCLITISQEDTNDIPWLPLVTPYSPIFTVSFAHYTVLEYLESKRILDSPASTFSLKGDQSAHQLFQGIFRNAIQAQTALPYEWDGEQNTVEGALEGYINAYFVVLFVISLYHCPWVAEVPDKEYARTTALQLLNPFGSHYDRVQEVFKYFDTDVFDDSDIFCWKYFSAIHWGVCDATENSIIPALVNMCQVDKSWGVLKWAHNNVPRNEILHTKLQLKLGYIPTDVESGGYFEGSIIDLLAQNIIDTNDHQELISYIEFITKYMDPSVLLVSYIHSHNHKIICKENCIVERILELGAVPNVLEYQITPLQIAAATFDIAAVRVLLAAGADPNSIGNKAGIRWKPKTILGRFNCLFGYSPLHICRHFDCMYKGRFDVEVRTRNEEREKTKAQIEAILIEFGAKDVSIGEQIESQGNSGDNNEDECGLLNDIESNLPTNIFLGTWFGYYLNL